MTPAQLIMLGLGLAAFAAGMMVLAASSRGTDAQRYARRMAGSMMAALGAALTVFALGLAGKLEGAK
jgi:hypothetical protein